MGNIAQPQVLSSNYQVSDQGLIAWTADPAIRAGGTAPSAGVMYLLQVIFRNAGTTPATIHVNVSTAGTGVTPLANCSVGLFNSAGTLIGSSADQSTPWATTGDKAISISQQSAGSLTSLAAGYYWVGILVGTQSQTNVQLSVHSAQPSMINASLSASAYRAASTGSALSALPPSFTPSGLTQANLVFAAIS